MKRNAPAEHKLSLRVTVDMIKRADALRPRLARDPTLAALGQVSRSAVIKLAIARGLEVLEHEYK